VLPKQNRHGVSVAVNFLSGPTTIIFQASKGNSDHNFPGVYPGILLGFRGIGLLDDFFRFGFRFWPFGFSDNGRFSRTWIVNGFSRNCLDLVFLRLGSSGFRGFGSLVFLDLVLCGFEGSLDVGFSDIGGFFCSDWIIFVC
jgi:hypothetical protein